MQTFILDHNIRKSADYLDTSRLHKQAVEIKQILLALEPGSLSKWRSHPATQQWTHFQSWLASYGLACVERWTAMGFKSTLGDFLAAKMRFRWEYFPVCFRQLIPYHRALLRYKRWTYYASLWSDEDSDYIEYHSVYLDENDKMFKVINGKRVYVTS